MVGHFLKIKFCKQIVRSAGYINLTGTNRLPSLGRTIPPLHTLMVGFLRIAGGGGFDPITVSLSFHNVVRQ